MDLPAGPAASPPEPAPAAASPAAQSLKPETDYFTRLGMLRSRCRSALNTVGVLSLFPSLIIGSFVGYYSMVVAAALVALAETAIGVGSPATDALFSYLSGMVVFLVPMIIAGCLAYLLWRMALSYFARHYWRVTAELDSSGLMAMVVNDEWTRLLGEVLDDRTLMRWMSPPPPRRLEEQLEYAACFHDQLRRMQSGRINIDGNALWNGSLGWFTGQRSWCLCACASPVCLGCGLPLFLPFWVVSGIYYVQKIAATTAYCDFLLRGTPLAGPTIELQKLQPRRMRQPIAPPAASR